MAPCARASLASPSWSPDPQPLAAQPFRGFGFPPLGLSTPRLPRAGPEKSRRRGCSWGVYLPEYARSNLRSRHYPHPLQSALPPFPESEDLQREVERGAGPPPPRLNAGSLAAATSVSLRVQVRAHAAAAVVNAHCPVEEGMKCKQRKASLLSGGPGKRVSRSAQGGVYSPRAPRGLELGGRALLQPSTVRAATGAQRACALRGAGGRAERSGGGSCYPAPQRPKSLGNWAPGNLWWFYSRRYYQEVISSSVTGLREIQEPVLHFISKLTDCCPHLEDIESYSRRK